MDRNTQTTETTSQAQAAHAFPVDRHYVPCLSLKYGINPHQSPAALLALKDAPSPLRFINGTPGFINLLDAINSFQLVCELSACTGLVAAASFKHCSPAGAAVAVKLKEEEFAGLDIARDMFDSLTPAATAYIRARQADPKSSFGDFCSLSSRVDAATARLLAGLVSDGIIASAFDEEAVEILKKKKNGAFILIECSSSYVPPLFEYRELFGVALVQRRNDAAFTTNDIQEKAIKQGIQLTSEQIIDVQVAAVTSKYTQSNSVVYAVGGQVVGVGAGQQSRVDCVRLAGTKAEEWFLRKHPDVINLPFKSGVKRTDRTNARMSYIQGDLSAFEQAALDALMERPVGEMDSKTKKEFLKQLKGLALSSDGFFPFRDSLDQAAKRGVSVVIQPGGSAADEAIRTAAQQLGMKMIVSGVRLFHH